MEALTRNGHSVTLVTAFPHYPDGDVPRVYRTKAVAVEYRGPVRVIRVWIPPIAHKGALRRLCLYLAFVGSSFFSLPYVGKVDLVWAMSPNYLCMLPAGVFRMLNNCKIVHDVVDIWPEAIDNSGFTVSQVSRRLIDGFTKICYALSDVIVTLSPSLASSLKGRVPNSIPVVVLGNCVKESFFELPPAEPNRRDTSIMYLGTLSPANDFSLIIEAAKKFSNENVRFRIVGTGEQAELITELMKRASKNVEFDPCSVRPDSVPRMLSEADILIVPLKSGFGDVSFPSKLVEYLATGRPVICVADGALAEIIRSESIALAVEPGDATALVEAITKLREDYVLSAQLASKGRDYARREFSFESFVRQVNLMRPDLLAID